MSRILYFLFISLTSISNVIATDVLSPDLETITLPKNYKHFNVSQQLENYHKIYDNPAQSKGLFAVLTNAFALINDQIVEDKTHESNKKEKYLKFLTDLWVRAAKHSDTMASSMFQGFNRNLTYIIDCYTKDKEISINHVIHRNPLAFPDWRNHFLKFIQDFKNTIGERFENDCETKNKYIARLTKIEDYLNDPKSTQDFNLYGSIPILSALKVLDEACKYGEEEPAEPRVNRSQLQDPNMSDNIFIIYGLPKPAKARNIAPSHFVEEFLHDNYSSYVSFVDTLSKPVNIFVSNQNKRTHKDPHWSLENGTEQLHEHDLDHIRRIKININAPTAFGYLKEALAIQKKLKGQGKNNEASVLMNGLFMIIHERPDVVAHAMLDPDVKTGNQRTKFFQLIVSKFKSTITTYHSSVRGIPGLHPHGSKKYKEENRDWEFILKAKYVESDSSIKPVHDENGTFLPIAYDVEQKKMTRPFNDDPKRNEKMTNALETGYERFWTYFLSLIEKNSRAE